jgi:hypothetical protein
MPAGTLPGDEPGTPVSNLRRFYRARCIRPVCASPPASIR